MAEEKKKITDLNFEKGGDFYITGIFDDTVSKNIMPALKKKVAEELKKKDGKIVFYINSNGGLTKILKGLLFWIDKAKAGGVIVETNVLGDAFSCGSLLACVGTKGHRFIAEYGEHVCHFGNVPSVSYTPEELERNAGRAKRHFGMIEKIYKNNTTEEFGKEVGKYMKTDSLYIDSKDCVKFGLADKIIK